MALLRLVHAAEMPDPSELARLLKERGLGLEGAPPAPAPAPAATTPVAEIAPAPVPGASATPSPSAFPADFAALVEALGAQAPRLGAELHDCVSLVRYAPPELDVRLLQPLDADFTRQVAAALKTLTGAVWTVTSSKAMGEPSLREQQAMEAQARRDAILATPVVAAAVNAFPGAVLVDPGDAD